MTKSDVLFLVSIAMIVGGEAMRSVPDALILGGLIGVVISLVTILGKTFKKGE